MIGHHGVAVSNVPPMPPVQVMPNGDRVTDLSADWFEVLPAAGGRGFFVHRPTNQSQFEFPQAVLAALGRPAAPAPPPSPDAAADGSGLQRRIVEREATLALLREMGCREDDTADLEADLAALHLEAAQTAPTPTPAPASGLGQPPAFAPAVRAFCHISGGGTKTSYSDAENRLISEAQARGTPAVRLSGGFEVRFDANAVSSKWDTPPDSGMIQVNLSNDHTRLVKALSSSSPSASPAQAPAPTPVALNAPPPQPSHPSATSEATIRRRIAEQEATLALLRETGMSGDQLSSLEADIATLRAAILPPAPRCRGAAASGGGSGRELQRGVSTTTGATFGDFRLFSMEFRLSSIHFDCLCLQPISFG